MYNKAIETAKRIYGEAKDCPDQLGSKRLGQWASRSQSRGQIENMLKLASEELSISIDEFDTNHETINSRNGMVDLRTKELLKPSPDSLVMKCTSVNYNPEAKCPTWLKFLDEVYDGNTELIDYVQQALGYSLTGLCSEQCFFILYGRGHNGKGTFAETVLSIMGDYAGVAQFEVFTNKDKSNVRVLEQVGLLKGRRFALASETDGNARFSEALVKRLTGEDTLQGTKLGKGAFEFKPAHKLWFQANHLPAIKDASKGMWKGASYPVQSRFRSPE